jgi:Ca2+-binding RTX toxin-like protein
MSDHARGGDDTLAGGNDLSAQSAGTFDNILVGDAHVMSDRAHGGNDTLISGTGNDDMWGDAQVMLDRARGGNDTFVFDFSNGHDRIEDFGQGVHGVMGSNWGTDLIDVSALGIHDFSELAISAFDTVAHESTTTFSAGNDVVVHSQVALTHEDFLFATQPV